MKRKLRLFALSLIVFGLLAVNVQVSAHDWWIWCWHRGNTLNVFVFGSNQAEANAALDDWQSHTHLRLPRRSSHTDISVFGGNFGNTGWWGLATIENFSFDWWHHWFFCRIEHAHARFNTFYGGTSDDVRGVFCQEIGHTFGLDHSNTGDCMGKGYFNNINNTGPHNWADINSRF